MEVPAVPAFASSFLPPMITGSADYTYSGLEEEYGRFSYPEAEILLSGKKFADKAGRMVVSDVSVELTSGFEASVARFRIYNAYDSGTGQFRYEDVKSQVLLGVSMTVSLGYSGALEPVFTGFVAQINFLYESGSLPCIEVTGMDIKGIMMANRYASQLTAKYYSDAVTEVLDRAYYKNLSGAGGYMDREVSDTPDKISAMGAPGVLPVDMAFESDYEFVVKIAKRFNYEFFVDRGVVYFRPAKNNRTPLIELGVGSGVIQFNIGYSLTGLTETVEARTVNAGSGKLISKKKTMESGAVGSAAKQLLKESRKVYVDPSIVSDTEAQARADSLAETMAYRLGSLECECIGLPELTPGRFIRISGLGAPADNWFYLTGVIHDFTSENGFRTKIMGRACSFPAAEELKKEGETDEPL